tara:strand:+ start:15288 stop:15569 length:282 start_codon:yes stop_codon:yes gene_type:complete
MPLRKRGLEEEDSTGLLKKKNEERKKKRNDRVENRRSFRLEKIAAIRDKFYAVAAKRKWLVFMIVAAIAAYLIIFKGGFSFGGEWVDKVKGLF